MLLEAPLGSGLGLRGMPLGEGERELYLLRLLEERLRPPRPCLLPLPLLPRLLR